LRITFIIPKIGTSGGLRVVAVYADRLRRRGHQVTVVSVPPLRVSALRKLARRILRREQSVPNVSKASYFDQLNVPVKVLESMRSVTDSDVPEGDIVVATWWETAEWVSALSSNKGIQVYFIQGHEVFPFLPIERTRATYRLPLHKIVISNWLKDVMRTEYGDQAVDLIYNSVDTEQFFAPKRCKQTDPTVGFLYSTPSLKGVDVLLSALAEIKKQLPSLRAVAFGSDQVSPGLPLPDWVRFQYQPPQDQIRLIYGQCDVWLCASRTEGFHLPPLEAMACRCPVVSTRVGGPMDTVEDGVNGFLVDIGDSAGLAKKALTVLQLNCSKWQRMSDAAFATATRYSWDDAAQQMEKIFLGLSEEKQ
jgi:glycosyltransferase involved in cell wall biosynthesis